MSRKTTFATAALLSLMCAGAALAQGKAKGDTTSKKQAMTGQAAKAAAPGQMGKGEKMEKKAAKMEKKGEMMEKKGEMMEKKGAKMEKKGAKMEKKGAKMEKKGEKMEKKTDEKKKP